MHLIVLLSSLLLVTLPEDLETSLNNLKKAEAAKDAAQVKKLAAQAHMLASEVIEDKAADADRLAYAKDVDLYSEYALFSTAAQAQAAVTVDLLSTLEKQNPKSKYLPQAYPRYFVALQQTGDTAKIPTVAEAATVNFPDNEDLLLIVADSAYSKKQPDKALRFAERLVARPQGKRAATLGRAYWIAGVVYSEKTQYFKANQNLRASLPYLQGKDELLGSALFYLGVANYQLGSQTRNRAQVLEAAKFSEQAAALQGPLSQQAWRNAQAMKTEAAKMR